jgi:hypothetical protein
MPHSIAGQLHSQHQRVPGLVDFPVLEEGFCLGHCVKAAEGYRPVKYGLGPLQETFKIFGHLIVETLLRDMLEVLLV